MKRFWGRQDVLAATFLGTLAILIYDPLTLQGRVLSSFDSLVYFYPNAVYLAERLRAGQVPLWDPYLFAGVPFLANSQVGVLYPPNWLYLLGPVSRIYAILVVVHVWWLAFGTYLVGRASVRLGRMAALFAAVAVAYGGFVGGMNGHLNQLEALAWAPLAILLVERGAVRSDWRIEVLAALPFAVAALAGHSQELYMTGVIAGLAGLARVAQRSGLRSEIWSSGFRGRGVTRQMAIAKSGASLLDAEVASPPRPLSIGDGEGVNAGSHSRPRLANLLTDLLQLAIGPALAIVIAAAQLLPTLELTRLSIRATGLDFPDASAFSLPPPLMLTTLLPTIGQAPQSTEWFGYVGLTAIVLAVVGLWRRPSPEAWWLAGLALLGLLLAFGRYTPVYSLAFEFVPGVRLFRVPARWLTLWTFGVGLLAGWGFDVLLGSRREPDDFRWLRLGKARRAILAVVLVGVFFAALLAYRYRSVVSWPTPATLALWGATAVGLLAMSLLARRWRRFASLAMLALLVGELGVASAVLPFQRAVWMDAVETTRLSVDHLLAQRSSDRVLALGDNSFDPGDLPELRKMLAGTLPPEAQDEYITALKHIEGLTPNLPLRFGLRTIDGYDGGVLPLDRFDDMKRLFPEQGPVVVDGRLRLQLKSAPDARLLGWLNVRYLLMDRLRDRWIDGVYFDLSVTQLLQPGTSLTLSDGSAFPTTALGVMLRSADGGSPTGTLKLDADGQGASLEVGSGKLVGQHISTDLDPNGVWFWTIDLPKPRVVHTLTMTWQGSAPVALRSLSLIDRRTGASQPVVVSPDYRLDFLGDVKIYENRDVLPRAFLATGLDVVPDADAVISELGSPSWSAQQAAVASAADVSASLAFRATGDPGQARIVDDEPERVVVETSAPGRRVLVLTDSYYPGWDASVDGVSVSIMPVNTLFRGVIVGPGPHRVVFTYRPWSWRLGVALSLVGLAVTALALTVRRR